MKKIVFFFLMTILIASCHQEELSSVPDEPEGKQPVFDLSEEEVLQGCIYVKLKEEPAGEVRVRSIGNTVTTGVKVLDRAASSLKIERMERTFPYAGKFEERTRKEGLHLWYNVWFSKETSATRAATEVAFLDGIETAVPVPKIVSRATPETSFTDNVLYCHSGSCNTGRGIVCSVLSPDGRYTCRNFGYVGYRKK